MMVLAMYTLNIAHPGVLLANPRDNDKKDEEKLEESTGGAETGEEETMGQILAHSLEVDGAEWRRRTPLGTQNVELDQRS